MNAEREQEVRKATLVIANSPEPQKKLVNGTAQRSLEKEFVAVTDDHYQLSVPEWGITFDIDRLRREKSELFGELAVRCDLPGARTVDGTLSIADFNLSGIRARGERAKLLKERANTGNKLDWLALV